MAEGNIWEMRTHMSVTREVEGGLEGWSAKGFVEVCAWEMNKSSKCAADP